MTETVIRTEGDRTIVVTRRFAAPPGLVFRALTEPGLVERWLGPHDWPLVEAAIDLRIGGAYRFVAEGPGGTRMGWGGIYEAIERPVRLVHTERFDEAWYPGDALVTTLLTETAGRTQLQSTIVYQSEAARAAVLASPMEGGMRESYERMDELLADLAATQ